MNDIYAKLGVQRIINGRGASTAVGGSIMAEEVVEAMLLGARVFVSMDELMAKASSYIARTIGVDAAYITSGAAAGVLIASAACLTGTDPARIARLPEVDWSTNQIVTPRPQSLRYLHQAVRATGARLLLSGSDHNASVENITRCLNQHTAAVLLCPGETGHPPVKEVHAVLRGTGIRLIVDAAAQLPPRSNLTRFLTEGADLVIFSGGKGLRGPQDTGLLLGSSTLIRACVANGSPNHAIGRVAKTSKEAICGLVRAVELFLSKDEAQERARCISIAQTIAATVNTIIGIRASVELIHETLRPFPRVYMDVDPVMKCSWRDMSNRLRGLSPPIEICVTGGRAYIDVLMLPAEDVDQLLVGIRRTVADMTQEHASGS